MNTRFHSLVFLGVLLISCSGNRLDVDVSGIKIKPVKIERFEQDLFKKPNPDVAELRAELKKKYGNFYDSFQSIINFVGKPDSSDLYNLKMYVSDPDVINTYKDCQQLYPDLSWLEKDLGSVFRYYTYYFPGRSVPRVVSDMSAFYYYILSVDTTIGIDLEMYLGSANKTYQMIQYPRFKTMTMRREYLVPDFVQGWMTTVFPKPENESNKNFLNEIIYKGKLLYLSDALLPHTEDTLKIGYTFRQLEWCKANEYNMWAFFVQKKILYNSDPAEIVKYTGEGPFTSAFNKESPSRVGIWIGWQIVRSYMNHYPDVSLETLMNEKDAQVILSKSRYKPSR